MDNIGGVGVVVESMFGRFQVSKNVHCGRLEHCLASFAKFAAARCCFAPLEQSDFYPQPSL